MTEMDRLERLLRSCAIRKIEGERRASVALIFRENSSGELELFFIHRAEHPQDPWSGHMGFPGGRVDAADASPLDAVYREVREEIGVDLEGCGRLLARLSDQRAVAKGKRLGLVIEARVFQMLEDVPMRANSEVQDLLWIPVSYFRDGEKRSEMDYPHGDVKLRLPCYRYGEKLIWGLSLLMLDEVLACLDAADGLQ